MEKQEALEHLSQVCAIYKGNLQEHQVLQEALKVVDSLIDPRGESERIKED